MRNSSLALTLAVLMVGCIAASPPSTSPAKVRDSLPPALKLNLPGYVRGGKDSHAQRVIIFIHGIFGDGTSTWTNATNGAYFPALVRDDKSFNGVDIWVHEFDSPKLRRSNTIDELADHLRKYLNNDNVIANHQELIFVCHSMGGLVARAYLLKYRDVAPERVRMMYFFSTPTTGSDLANLAHLISSNPQLADMRKMTTDDAGVLGVWEAQWSSSPFAQHTLSYCAYELLPTDGVTVVQRESARHLCNTRPDPIERDHVNIVKPANNTTDESYVAFREAYRDTFEHNRDSGKPPIWNLSSEDTGMLRIQNITQSPNCLSTCWSDQVVIAPGDDIKFDISYDNGSLTTAKDAHLYLTIPPKPLLGTTVLGTVTAADSTPAFGSISIESIGGPILLTPTAAWSYDKHDPTKTHDLPYQQKASVLASADGLRLGDVAADSGEHHVVVQFHCEPVTLVGISTPDNLLDVAKGLVSGESDIQNRFPTADGHIDTGEIGEQTRWASDLHDINDESSFMLYLYHFNNTTKELRNLHAKIALDRDDPTTLRVTLTSDDGVVRSANARIAYRQGTIGRPVLTGAWHAPKTPLSAIRNFRALVEKASAHDLAPEVFPVQGDDIDLGNLTPQTQVAAFLVYQIRPQGEEVLHPTINRNQNTTLNDDEDDGVLAGSMRTGNGQSTDYHANFKNGSPLPITFYFHNTGHVVARNIHLHLSMSRTSDQLIASGTITASNAPQVNGVARVRFEHADPDARSYYDQALLYRSRTDEGRDLDASHITEEGVNVGDLDPDEWGNLTIDFITVSGMTLNDDCDNITATPGWPLEVAVPVDNAKNIVRRDVMLSLQLSGGPDDFALPIVLTEAGRVVHSHTIHIQAVSHGSGVSLRYRDATIHTATRAQSVDASTGEVMMGDIAPRSGLVLRVRYEIIPNDE
jgi:pimeloyl-ACP methyl ester carboxylesterase